MLLILAGRLFALSQQCCCCVVRAASSAAALCVPSAAALCVLLLPSAAASSFCCILFFRSVVIRHPGGDVGFGLYRGKSALEKTSRVSAHEEPHTGIVSHLKAGVSLSIDRSINRSLACV